MKNGIAVTNLCQHSPGAGSCRALSRATRAALAGTWPWESLVPGKRRSSRQQRSSPVKMLFGKFFRLYFAQPGAVHFRFVRNVLRLNTE